MEYTSLSWNDFRLHEHRLYECCYPLSNLCHEWTLICLVCADCRSFHLYLLMIIWHHVLHMTSCCHQQHDEWCHSWIKISKLCTSGWKVKNINIIHKWIQYLHYAHVVKRLKMSMLCTSVWKVKNVKTMKDTFLIRDNFNFHFVNFPFICNSIPAAPAYGVYVSQLKRYSAS